MNLNELYLWYSVILSNKTERSVSLILVILGNLDHFRHSFTYPPFLAFRA